MSQIVTRTRSTTVAAPPLEADGPSTSKRKKNVSTENASPRRASVRALQIESDINIQRNTVVRTVYYGSVLPYNIIEEADFKDIQKNAYPIVVCYNGRDHFTPTRPSSQSKFLKWKLNKELGPILSAALLVIEELVNTVNDDPLVMGLPDLFLSN